LKENKTMRILFLAAEADPFIKVGGLGDVAGSLPAALLDLSKTSNVKNENIDVRLVIPFHPAISRDNFHIDPLISYTIPSRDGDIKVHAYRGKINQLEVWLISGDGIDTAKSVYSGDNEVDGLKYAFFSIAALELSQKLDWRPDIIHANDWHTAYSVYALHLLRKKYEFWKKTKSLISIHNLPYMGTGSEKSLFHFMLPPGNNSHLPVWARELPLPLALLTADQIVAVSPSYAQEILTPEFSCALEGLLNSRSETITGILNGLDIEFWNPSIDKFLTAPFSANQLKQRNQNKSTLQIELGLPQESTTPLVIVLGRMDVQKGVDLAIESFRNILDLPWQLIFLGTGNKELEYQCKLLADDFPSRIRSINRFDSPLSHRLYAGGDILLMPSRYEPCGLAQMIAMNYGCVPVAHATGGLKDTIIDSQDKQIQTGFLFENATSHYVTSALQRAFNVYSNRKQWKQLQLNGMKKDFSWHKSALEYANIYAKLVNINIYFGDNNMSGSGGCL
jgi:starch synthase